MPKEKANQAPQGSNEGLGDNLPDSTVLEAPLAGYLVTSAGAIYHNRVMYEPGQTIAMTAKHAEPLVKAKKVKQIGK